MARVGAPPSVLSGGSGQEDPADAEADSPRASSSGSGGVGGMWVS